MLDKKINSLEKSDIQALLDNQVPEGRTIEYKQLLEANGDDDKAEFLKDVSSFANAGGGDILFGITETRNSKGEPTGLPEAITGISLENWDKEQLRLDNIIRSGIEPKLLGYQFRLFDVGGKTVLLLRVKESWTKPHQVSFRAKSQFFTRTSNGKSPMDLTEVRNAIIGSAELPERLRNFRNERIGYIVSGDLPYEIQGPELLIFHLIPYVAFLRPQSADLDSVTDLPTCTRSYGDIRANLDGVAKFFNGGDDRFANGYTQLFHSGILEIVDGLYRENLQGPSN